MSRRKKEARDYEVGYGRPPVHSRFKPGRSGNPRGRPKGRNRSPDLGRTFGEILAKRVTVIENGREHTMTLEELLVTSMVTSAAKGNAKARSDLLRFIKAFPLPDADRNLHGTPIDYGAEVRAKLEEMARNLEESREPETDTPGPDKQDGPDEPEQS